VLATALVRAGSVDTRTLTPKPMPPSMLAAMKTMMAFDEKRQ
jgi:hypothetical protein